MKKRHIRSLSDLFTKMATTILPILMCVPLCNITLSPLPLRHRGYFPLDYKLALWLQRSRRGIKWLQTLGFKSLSAFALGLLLPWDHHIRNPGTASMRIRDHSQPTGRPNLKTCKRGPPASVVLPDDCSRRVTPGRPAKESPSWVLPKLLKHSNLWAEKKIFFLISPFPIDPPPPVYEE